MKGRYAMTILKDLSADDMLRNLDPLVETLVECVQAGASVNFILPFDRADATLFWLQKVHPMVASGKRILFVAEEDGEVAGTVQLDLDTPPNQPHRGEVTKLLVRPSFRRRGIARRLMLALEERAKALNKSLITLDTRSGDAAEPLYRSLGFIEAGRIPGFSRAAESERLDSTTYMYKQITPC